MAAAAALGASGLAAALGAGAASATLSASTLTASPPSAVAGSTGNTLNFTYTTPNPGLPGKLTLKIPGFSKPTLTNVTTGNLTGCASATPTGVSGGGTITISFDCGTTGTPVTGGSFTIQVANEKAAKIAGTYQVVAGTNTAPITSPPSFMVVPGPEAMLAITNLPTSVDSEVPTSLSVTAEDAFKNVVPDYTGTVRFSSTDPRATLPASYSFQPTDNSTHVFSGLLFYTPGRETIYAGDGTVTSAKSTMVVAPTSIAVSPSSPSVQRGLTQQFMANVTYPDQTVNGDTHVIWSSDTSSVATIGASTGLATGNLVGSANISATLSGVVGSTGISVTPGSTITSLGSSANPAVSSQPVTLTATVSQTGLAGPLTGTVTFTSNGTTTLGTSPLVGGTAMLTYTPPAGSYSIVASYSGDANNQASDNSASPLSQVVNLEGTTVSLASSTGGTSTYGQSATFTATVSPQSTPSGLAPANGFVTFSDAYGHLFAAVPVFGSTAAWATSALPVGATGITAAFIPTNTQQSGSSDSTTQTVSQATATASDSPSETSYSSGDTVTFTVTVSGVSGAATPSGSVTVDDGQGDANTASVSGGTALVQVTLNSAAAAGGATLDFTATYSGDTNYASASDAGSGGVTLTPNTPPGT
jgi:hypothetical protein